MIVYLPTFRLVFDMALSWRFRAREASYKGLKVLSQNVCVSYGAPQMSYRATLLTYLLRNVPVTQKQTCGSSHLNHPRVTY